MVTRCHIAENFQVQKNWLRMSLIANGDPDLGDWRYVRTYVEVILSFSMANDRELMAKFVCA